MMEVYSDEWDFCGSLADELDRRALKQWIRELLAMLTPSELELARDIMYGKTTAAMTGRQRMLLLRIRRKAYELRGRNPLPDDE